MLGKSKQKFVFLFAIRQNHSRGAVNFDQLAEIQNILLERTELILRAEDRNGTMILVKIKA